MLLAEARHCHDPAPPEAARTSPARSNRKIATDRCVDALLAMGWDAESALAQLTQAGMAAVSDVLAIVTDAARVLGERWVADTASFSDVTLGLHRLTLLLFAFEARPGATRRRLHGGAVLLAPAPGDQHGFGLAVVGFTLRRAGWDVTAEMSGDPDAIVALSRRGFDCVGLSVGHERALRPTSRLLGRLRAVAGRRNTVYAVGGPLLFNDPDLAAKVGADISAIDGAALVRQLRPLRPIHAA